MYEQKLTQALEKYITQVQKKLLSDDLSFSK